MQLIYLNCKFYFNCKFYQDFPQETPAFRPGRMSFPKADPARHFLTAGFPPPPGRSAGRGELGLMRLVNDAARALT